MKLLLNTNHSFSLRSPPS